MTATREGTNYEGVRLHHTGDPDLPAGRQFQLVQAGKAVRGRTVSGFTCDIQARDLPGGSRFLRHDQGLVDSALTLKALWHPGGQRRADLLQFEGAGVHRGNVITVYSPHGTGGAGARRLYEIRSDADGGRPTFDGVEIRAPPGSRRGRTWCRSLYP